MALVVKNLPPSAEDLRDLGSIPGSGSSLGEGHGNPLQYSCLENPHRQRSLVGYSPQGCKESDTTEVTWHAHTQTGSRTGPNRNAICFRISTQGKLMAGNVLVGATRRHILKLLLQAIDCYMLTWKALLEAVEFIRPSLFKCPVAYIRIQKF